MIMIWNRKEVYNGNSIKEFNELCDKLAANKIYYRHRVVNRGNASIFGSNRAYTGTFGEKTSLSYEYHIYVHKDDYDKSCQIIRR